MRLSELQNEMFEWVCGSEAIPEGPAQKAVNGGALSAVTRVGVYAEMYWLRMRDTLRSDHPLVLAVVGEERFDALVAAYIRVHPSTRYSLGLVGTEFPKFLEGAALDDLPWVSELAKLELAHSTSFTAENSDVLEMAALAAIDGETFAHSRLTACPSVHVVDFSYDVLPVWRALKKEEKAPEVEKRAVHVVVWRKAFEVFHVEVSANEADALREVIAGSDLPTVCGPFSDSEDAATVAFQAIGSWVSEGMMAALQVDAA